MNTKNGTYYKMHYIVNEAYPRFKFMSYEEQEKFIEGLLTLRRLAKKHHRLAEMSCNGEGVIRGKFYTWDNSNKARYASPALESDYTVFDAESDKVEAKIKAIAERLGLRVEFQGDPRGYTVKVFMGDRFLDIQG